MLDPSDYLPVDNSFDVYVENFHAAADPDTPLTDAAMTFTLYDLAGDAVSGATAVEMSHRGSGEYRGSAEPTLTAGTIYKLVITCSNYTAAWTQYYPARTRPFGRD